MRNALLLLTALVIASCGGGGGGGGSSSAGGNNPPPPPSPQSSYPTVRGNLYYSSADALGNLFGIDYVCAVYRDTGQWIADVPVRDNCVRVENNAFTMHLSGAGDYALFFFNATASPIGFAGKDGGVYVLHLGDGNTTLSIYLEQDAQGQVEGDVAEKSLIVSDDDYFFNNDSDGDGVKDVVDPDWLTQRFLKVKFINVSLLQKEQGLFIDNSTENDNDPVPVYYYLNIRNAVEPMGFISFEGNSTLTSAVNMVQQGDVFTPYLIPTDENANLIFSEGYYDLTVPKLAAYREVIPVFVAPSPLNPTFDDYEALKNNVLYAIADWNNYIRQADPQAGFVFLGAVPYVNGTLSCGQGPTVDNVTDKAPIPGSVVVFRDTLPSGVLGRTERVDSCSLPEPVSALVSTRPLTVDINLTGTDPWLIYNPDANAEPAPFYRVRFVGQSGWTGHGRTGNVVESNASKRKLRRLEW